MSRYEYNLVEFTNSLAREEKKQSENLLHLVQTFTSSRRDLPLEKFERLAKVHETAGERIKECMKEDRDDLLNLWQLCNIYSVMAVDLAEAMKQTRAKLRKRIEARGIGEEDKKKEKSIRQWFNSQLSRSDSSSRKSTLSDEEKKPSFFEKIRTGSPVILKKQSIVKKEKPEAPPVRPPRPSAASIKNANLCEYQTTDSRPPLPPTSPPPPQPPSQKIVEHPLELRLFVEEPTTPTPSRRMAVEEAPSPAPRHKISYPAQENTTVIAVNPSTKFKTNVEVNFTSKRNSVGSSSVQSSDTSSASSCSPQPNEPTHVSTVNVDSDPIVSYESRAHARLIQLQDPYYS